MKSHFTWLAVGAASLALPVFGQTLKLSVEQAPNSQILLRWAGPAGDSVLERADQLGAAAVWRAVSQVPVAANGALQLQLPAGATAEYFRLRKAPTPALTSVARVSPGAQETGVSVNRETIVVFSGPLRADSVLTTNLFFAEAAGRRLLTRLELSPNRQVATLFYLEPIPAGSRVRVRLLGDGLNDSAGHPVDVDGDGLAGGVRQWTFDTMSTAAVPGTAIVGHVFDSAPVAGPGGGHTNLPLEGVQITVDGAEERLRTETDADGFFRLSPCPAGRFFLCTSTAERRSAAVGQTARTIPLWASLSRRLPGAPITWSTTRVRFSCHGSRRIPCSE